MENIINFFKAFKCKDTLWSLNLVWWREEANNRFTVDHRFSTADYYKPYVVYDHFNREIVDEYDNYQVAQDKKELLVNRYIQYKVKEERLLREKLGVKK